MFKLFLVLLLCFGAFCAIAFIPAAWGTAFHVSGKAVPWIVLGVCLFGYIGYKKIGS